MLRRRIYREGRCRTCTMRVVIDRENDGHTRAGRWCGPIEADQPSEVPDEPLLNWIVSRREYEELPNPARPGGDGAPPSILST